MTLLVRTSLADILLLEKIITKYMKENNITDINEIHNKNHEIIIQEKYNKIIKDLDNV